MGVLGDWAYLGGVVFWNFGLFMYIPFFTAGVVGGRNGWLESVEEMKTWVVWVLRAVCLVVWVLIFLSIAHTGIPIPNCCGIDGSFFTSFIMPVYATVITLAMIQILKAAGLDLQIIPMGEPIVAFFPLDASGN